MLSQSLVFAVVVAAAPMAFLSMGSVRLDASHDLTVLDGIPRGAASIGSLCPSMEDSLFPSNSALAGTAPRVTTSVSSGSSTFCTLQGGTRIVPCSTQSNSTKCSAGGSVGDGNQSCSVSGGTNNYCSINGGGSTLQCSALGAVNGNFTCSVMAELNDGQCSVYGTNTSSFCSASSASLPATAKCSTWSLDSTSCSVYAGTGSGAATCSAQTGAGNQCSTQAAGGFCSISEAAASGATCTVLNSGTGQCSVFVAGGLCSYAGGTTYSSGTDHTCTKP